jgi:hypothetical protein
MFGSGLSLDAVVRLAPFYVVEITHLQPVVVAKFA